MAIKPAASIADTVPPNAAYPEGSAKDDSGPLTLDGTPLLALWLNDIWGLCQSVLDEAGIVANGAPDSVTNQQYLDAFKKVLVNQTDPDTVTLTNQLALILSNGSAQVLFDGADTLTALKRITCNDGGGNWNFRAGNRFNVGDVYVGNNGAVHQRFSSDAGAGNWSVDVAPVGVDGDPVNWVQALELGLNGLSLNSLPIDGRFNSNANGKYIIFPGGLIVQWGKQFNLGGQFTLPLPVPFTNLSDVTINLTPNQELVAKKETTAFLNGYTVNDFTYQVRDVDGNNAQLEPSEIQWFAIGS